MALLVNKPTIRLRIAKGKIVQRYFEQSGIGTTLKTDASQQRYFDAVSGRLTAIDFTGMPQQRQLQLILTDGGETYQLSMLLNSRYAFTFLMAVKNIDFGRPVKLMPWWRQFETGGKSALFIKQNNQSLKQYCFDSAATPLPPLQYQTVNGQTTIDNRLQLEFLERMVETDIRPLLKAVRPVL
jgi:hypothetical protein